ncbi:MAG TPA: T9SS type A sorting domain-containing protein [Chitinophagales bacterium]|nr:T9SS type A sorting domain-containing protein [Chitinophagales bacterium]MCB9075443.1 T9SS type A sorting domain-containing protein [Chitinophagales bacterium]HMU97797.1 T9SS type A sorting domain-containing protein [Chitinophagales bacterium]HMW93306.1 T9SS type A sorting domain-containing protein [Chitinophagales bacterium]HMY41560.1 T9SS type A sorting domain-containing protein [Chitinophagales bacterium]
MQLNLLFQKYGANRIKIIFYFIYLSCLFSNIQAAEINLDNTITTQPLPKFFTGAGMADISSALNHDTSGNQITNSYLNSEYLKLCKALKISDYRFPAGTAGNFYHFYGKGSGIDTTEVYCNPVYYGIRNKSKLQQFVNSYKFEQNLDKNYAYYFSDFMHEIQKDMPDAGFYYHLNSHTHFYKGQLKQLSPAIQELINQYFEYNNTLLNRKYDEFINSVDTNQIKIALNLLESLKNDSRISDLKQLLVSDANFQSSFQENINSIRYFEAQKLNLKGVEIGNETEAEYVLFDDDYTHYPYSCNVDEDSEVNPFTKIQLRDYMEGLIKNWIITTLYADSIHTNFNIPIGLTISGFRGNIGFDKNDNPYFIKQFGVLEKKAFFWSKFFGNESKIDAYIPHIYSQKVLECNNYTAKLDTTPSEQINKIAIDVIENFSDLSLPYVLKHINQTVNGKPLWITEWNFNMKSYVPNTFMHAYFLHRAISKNIEFYENNLYNIQSWLLHYLSATYYGYALVKSGYYGAKYTINKMLPYESFYMWGNTLNDQSKKLNINLSSQNNQAKEVQCFINKDKTKIFIHYNNISDNDDILLLNNITINDNAKNYKIKSVNTHILAAQTLLASNYTECQAVKNQIPPNSYTIIEDSLMTNFDTIQLPLKSIGQITLQIEANSSTKTKHSKKKENAIKIYPNPSNYYLNIEIQNFNVDENYTLKIFDTSGKIVKVFNDVKSYNLIDIHQLNYANYIISLFNDNELVQSQKFTKKN